MTVLPSDEDQAKARLISHLRTGTKQKYILKNGQETISTLGYWDFNYGRQRGYLLIEGTWFEVYRDKDGDRWCHNPSPRPVITQLEVEQYASSARTMTLKISA